MSELYDEPENIESDDIHRPDNEVKQKVDREDADLWMEIELLFNTQKKASANLKNAKADYDFYFGPESREAKERLKKALHHYEIADLALKTAYKKLLN